MWRSRLRDLGWSKDATDKFVLSWAKGTLRSYNIVLSKLYEFCCENEHEFPPVQCAGVADFMCHIARGSQRPQSILRTASAAIGHLYKARELDNLVQRDTIQRLITALVKGGTESPMTRSKVMPVKNFHDLFNSWPDNDSLSIKQLRIKAITLLALTLMLRPSDIAPNSVVYNDATGRCERQVFTLENLDFQDDILKVTFFGIKNDLQRKGFEVTLPRSNVLKLDPVRALQDYIDKTKSQRGGSGPVFLTLRPPYSAIDSSTVSRILEEAIALAGLSNAEFTAKSFRPTGATTAISNDINPEIVRKVGRWKNQEVFFSHYVHSVTPSDFTDKLICDN